MTCARCGSPAAYRFGQEGEESTYCRACAERVGPRDVVRLLGELTRERPDPNRPCPHCGWTRAQFSETGLLGCPLCYEVLEPEILAGFANP